MPDGFAHLRNGTPTGSVGDLRAASRAVGRSYTAREASDAVRRRPGTRFAVDPVLERDDLIDRGVHLPGLGDVSAEQGRIGHVEAERGRLAEVRALRDAVHVVLHACARGERPVEAAVAMVNDASLAAPVAPLIDAGGRRDERTTAADPWLVLRGVIARSAIELATTEPIALAECEAPSCGMLFRATSARQKWCSSGCGNRARVARHAARRRTGGAERRPRA